MAAAFMCECVCNTFPTRTAGEAGRLISTHMHDDDDVGLNVLGCRADILGTNCN